MLHKAGCGPELYAVFKNGICYEFIQGDVLSMEDVRSPDVYPIVAAEMAKVHCKIPINGVTTIPDGSTTSDKSMMWKKLETFNSLVEEILVSNESLVKRY